MVPVMSSCAPCRARAAPVHAGASVRQRDPRRAWRCRLGECASGPTGQHLAGCGERQRRRRSTPCAPGDSPVSIAKVRRTSRPMSTVRRATNQSTPSSGTLRSPGRSVRPPGRRAAPRDPTDRGRDRWAARARRPLAGTGTLPIRSHPPHRGVYLGRLNGVPPITCEV
jgi:hypothetical protein